jgi:O2-independent ubiquinone biosynthesis accessory factor UbiT
MNKPTLLHIPVLLLPLPITEAIANLAYQRVMSRHPALFERMDDHRDRLFCFAPTDWPVAFLARPSGKAIAVKRKPLQATADVTVEAPFGVLLRLLQGDADGDALFFSREIRVTGDMEALLALRNSLDDARVDLVEDVFGRGSPLASFLRSTLERLARSEAKGNERWN